MKSRTLSFNLTVLKKDITRFAPSWVLYTVGLLVTVMVCFRSSSADDTAFSLGLTAYGMPIVSGCYALINAQLLFGDLFSSRMTNSLHAFPIRRESWFAVHMVSGLLFSLVPNLVMALNMAVFSGSVPAMPWLWFLWASGMYVFFFCLAVLCAMCVGSRFAMVVVYGIANFGSLLVCWLYDTVYLPMLYGLTLDYEPFLKFSPVSYATVNIPYDLQWSDIYNRYDLTLALNTEILLYLGIVTVVGVALGALALVMYRKRHLEAAGDFISAGWLKPIFLVLYTLAVGVVFQWILGLFTGTEWLYLFIGLTVGYFTGQMLLMRTVRVFVKETFVGIGVLLGITAISLVLTALDPLGITRWVPKAHEVAHAEVSLGGYVVDADNGEDLDLLLQFHQTALDNRDEDTTVSEMKGTRITYTMKDGRTVERYYIIPTKGTAHMVVEPLLHRPEFILGDLYENWQTLRNQVEIYDNHSDDIIMYEKDWEGFISAVVQDCTEGNMIQDEHFHSGVKYYYRLTFRWLAPEGSDTMYETVSIRLYPESVHFRAWLEEQYFFQKFLLDTGWE